MNSEVTQEFTSSMSGAKFGALSITMNVVSDEAIPPCAVLPKRCATITTQHPIA
jgi:hypothetical protein